MTCNNSAVWLNQGPKVCVTGGTQSECGRPLPLKMVSHVILRFCPLVAIFHTYLGYSFNFYTEYIY